MHLAAFCPTQRRRLACRFAVLVDERDGPVSFPESFVATSQHASGRCRTPSHNTKVGAVIRSRVEPPNEGIGLFGPVADQDPFAVADLNRGQRRIPGVF
jgi:hypothetical protein